MWPATVRHRKHHDNLIGPWRAAASMVVCRQVQKPRLVAPGLRKPSVGAGGHIERAPGVSRRPRSTSPDDKSVTHYGRGTPMAGAPCRISPALVHSVNFTSPTSINAGVFILPEGGRSIVFIPPCSLDFGVRQSGWIACREGPVKRASGNQCAQCGAGLIAPEWSEHFPDHRIRNVWSCEACGYQFENTVYWSARELVDAE
jgi:hypothetical protein